MWVFDKQFHLMNSFLQNPKAIEFIIGNGICTIEFYLYQK